MKLGTSFGRCVRDIVNGDVDINDVAVIIARTLMVTKEDVLGVVEVYMNQRGYLLGLDSQLCEKVALSLFESGRIFQPRTLGVHTIQTPESHIWFDLCPTVLEQNEAVKDAWDNYQTVLRLASDQRIPEKRSANVVAHNLVNDRSMNVRKRVEIYERLLHAIHVARTITMNHDRVVKLLDLITAWDQAHSDHNGERSEKQVEFNIKQAMRKIDIFLNGNTILKKE